MTTGQEFLDLAASRIGEEYIYGANVDLDDADWHGPWDCAEFCTWVVKQITGHIYGALNPRSSNPDPWTGQWYAEMLAGTIIQVTVDRAMRTPGALLLKRNKKGGHIAFSDGRGTVEAMGADYGVCRGRAQGRGFQWGIFIPGVCYEEA